MAVDGDSLGVFPAVGLPLEVVGGPVGLLGGLFWDGNLEEFSFSFVSFFLCEKKKKKRHRREQYSSKCLTYVRKTAVITFIK